jgi:hypothetical protein
MPTATDDETGNLVNYVDVEDPQPLDTPTVPAGEPERQGHDIGVMKANRRRTYPSDTDLHSPTTQSHTPHTPRSRYHPPLLPPSESSFWDDLDTDTELEVTGWCRGRDGVLEKWTDIVPEPLEVAADQEGAYVDAVEAQREARRGGAGIRGTLGALGTGLPTIPPAPRLPRHLDKVILNTRNSHSHAAGGSSSQSRRSGRSGKHRSRRTGLGMTNLLTPDAAANATALATLETMGDAAATEQWAQADDSSVLPVPSHVVLHHLGTSAIRNGVLAVSDTTRYNKKVRVRSCGVDDRLTWLQYITTIYYKPT